MRRKGRKRRVRPAPFGIGDGWHIIEQQAYADASEVIDAIDLLCPGFTPEDHRNAPTPAGVEG